ncbi:MAG: VWA domain-containing protein, partial [Gammaproteobacteria bacterium]
MTVGRSVGVFGPGIGRLIGSLVCVGILLLGGGSPPAWAAEKTGVDAVLVIDSSGSMKWTDPRRLRVPAAKLFLTLLGEHDRAGIISFSDNGYPVLGLTPAGKTGQPRLFAAVEKVSEKGAYTNLHAALSKGLEMLAREGDPQRRRMLVLMTDGKMDTGDWDQ